MEDKLRAEMDRLRRRILELQDENKRLEEDLEDSQRRENSALTIKEHEENEAHRLRNAYSELEEKLREKVRMSACSLEVRVSLHPSLRQTIALESCERKARSVEQMCATLETELRVTISTEEVLREQLLERRTELELQHQEIQQLKALCERQEKENAEGEGQGRRWSFKSKRGNASTSPLRNRSEESMRKREQAQESRLLEIKAELRREQWDRAHVEEALDQLRQYVRDLLAIPSRMTSSFFSPSASDGNVMDLFKERLSILAMEVESDSETESEEEEGNNG